MATLHVRNVPDELYEQLRRRATKESRSLSSEVIRLLERALTAPAQADDLFWERLARRREHLERCYGRFPSSVDDIRADRSR